MSKYTSLKWISADEGPSGRQLVVHDISKALSGLTVASSKQPSKQSANRSRGTPINIISIFGRARQGKSFLMNCLAGETDIFKISNEKESCTQGIDISTKWLSLSQFSALSGSAAVNGPAAIGFVDAEGQGDRDVAYDAKLVCPILLASKCVIFNWKGDLQKDHLLSTLGVMAKAASNVASEAGTSTAKKFGHLHIVFRDWQAGGSSDGPSMGGSNVDAAAAAVLSDLFSEEKASEAGTRNQIRKDVKAAFESVTVWLFDPPTETTAALRQKLTIHATTPTFQAQLASLRSTLTSQLLHPTTTASTTLTTTNLPTLIQTIAASLNAGSVILPSSAYSAMLSTEIRSNLDSLDLELDAVLASYEDSLNKSLRAQLTELDKAIPTILSDPSKLFVNSGVQILGNQLHLNDEVSSMNAFKDAVRTAVNATNQDILSMFGESAKGALAAQLLANVPTSLANTQSRVEGRYLALYRAALTTYLSNARTSAEKSLAAAFQYLDARKWGVPDSSITSEFAALGQSCAAIAGAPTYSTVYSPDPSKKQESPSTLQLLQSSLAIIEGSVNAFASKYREANTLKLDAETRLASSLLESGLAEISGLLETYLERAREAIVNSSVQDVLSPLPLSTVETFLNQKYMEIRSRIETQASDRLQAATLRSVIKEFQSQCGALRPTMLARHEAVLQAAYQHTLAKHGSREKISELFDELGNAELSSEEELTGLLENMVEGIKTSCFEEMQGWGVSREDVVKALGESIDEKTLQPISECLNNYREAMAAQSEMEISEMEIADEEDVQTTQEVFKAKPSTSKLSVREQQERARLYALTQGWIKASKSKKTASSSTAEAPKKSTSKATSHAPVSVKEAREKAKEWASKELPGSIDENVNNSPLSSTRPSLDSKAKLALAKEQAKREAEERTKRALENIQSSNKKAKK